MPIKLVYEEEGQVNCVSISNNQDPQFYLDKFQGSFFMDTNDFPDQEFFQAWKIVDGQSIEIDLVKAKQLKLDQLREERKVKFKDIDALFIEKLSKEEDLTVIRTEMQKYRDITQDPRLVNPATIEDLKDVKLEDIEDIKIKVNN